MKRIVGYVLALTSALTLPLRGTDVGKLQPVGLIQLYEEAGQLAIITDSGDSGIGSTLKEAFEDLEGTTSGVIFLDTADYLIISSDIVQEIDELKSYLKPSVRICLAEERVDAVQAAEYLAVHRPQVKLKDFTDPKRVQKLIQENGRFKLK